MMSAEGNSTITKNIGKYYVAYRLSELGWKVELIGNTSRLSIEDASAEKSISVQVRSLSKRNAVPLGASLEKFDVDFLTVVRLSVGGAPIVYILDREDIMKFAHPNEKDGRTSYWIETRDWDRADFREAWSRIAAP